MFNKNCSKCNTELGFFTWKIKFKNGYLCINCDQEKKLSDEKISNDAIIDCVNLYVSKQSDDSYIEKILWINNELSSADRILFENKSIDKFIDAVQKFIGIHDEAARNSIDTTEIDNILIVKNFHTGILNFSYDLQKIYKIIERKGVNISYYKLIEKFSSIAKQKKEKMAKELLDPIYKHITDKYKIPVKDHNIIEELIIECRKIYPNFVVSSELASFLLKMFNKNYDANHIDSLIKDAQENIELMQFEAGLKHHNNEEIINFSDINILDGIQFEDFLNKFFTHNGYTVLKTARTGDQGADLVISINGTKTVVQAKKYSDKVGNKAVQEAIAAKGFYKAEKAMVITNSSFTKSAIDLALSCDVELWDGEKLKKNIDTSQKSKTIINSYVDNNLLSLHNDFEEYYDSLDEDNKIAVAVVCSSVSTINKEQVTVYDNYLTSLIEAIEFSINDISSDSDINLLNNVKNFLFAVENFQKCYKNKGIFINSNEILIMFCKIHEKFCDQK
ncbi:Restriction endonuclease [Desulfonatronum zhilinae]|nr:Restriction endonuclease [Desulfonatronum zhilinae]